MPQLSDTFLAELGLQRANHPVHQPGDVPACEIRSLIEQTTIGTRRRRVPEEVKEQVRRHAERRRSQVGYPERLMSIEDRAG